MRGKLQAGRGRKIRERNIPAYAGKTMLALVTAIGGAEHPRVCGENTAGSDFTGVQGGTSPRMRGKRKAMKTLVRNSRNIPAYAGKTLVVGNRKAVHREHPRVCGENGIQQILNVTIMGTSPRMRGKRYRKSGLTTLMRNIPAYAGKTNPAIPQSYTPTEHPRVCGENSTRVLTFSPVCGTSPRMRGKPSTFGQASAPPRNIPAYAGKT